tara:strand:+ start:845 stop:1369 length:525 start_codon:yes stop_codon:yes gene_type:complete
MLTEKVLFSKEECNSIIELAGEWVDSGLYHQGKNKIDESKRITKEARFNRLPELKKILLPKLKGLKLDCCTINDLPINVKLLKYTKGSFFKKHRDRGDGVGYRLWTMVIQLSDVNEYSGCNLNVEDITTSKQIGNTIIFDSGKLHEVTKLTDGERYALVCWFRREDILTEKSLT